MDATSERLFKHMAFANAELFVHLKSLPESALTITQPQSDWSVGEIVKHIVGASGAYLALLEGEPRPADRSPVLTHADLDRAAQDAADYDARFLVQAENAEGKVTFTTLEGETVTRWRSTILAQAIHHATEHRAHIADALAAAGHDVVDLDDMDIWSYGERVGGGA
jgi:uncharacterized damage-inducible protein DinB